MRRAAAGMFVGLWLWSAPAVACASTRFEVHLTVNHRAIEVGTPVRVTVRYYTFATGRRALSDGRTFSVVAVSPLGDRARLRVHRVARGTWTGAVRLRVVGTWKFRVANWPGSGTGPLVTVDVTDVAPRV